MAAIDDQTARVMVWCQRMKGEGDEDIAGLLARAELAQRKSDRKPRRKQAPNAVLADPSTGQPVKGSAFYFDERRGRA